MNEIIVYLYKKEENLKRDFKDDDAAYADRVICKDENAKLITNDGNVFWYLMRSDYDSWAETQGREKKIHLIDKDAPQDDVDLIAAVYKTDKDAEDEFENMLENEDVIDSYKDVFDGFLGMIKTEDVAFFYMSKAKYEVWRVTHPNIKAVFDI